MLPTRFILAAAVGIPLATGAALAQDYPERPITLIVPYGPGGGVSTNARALAPHLSEELGQEVVVEHREGGGGVNGFTMGANAEPDGYTLTMVSPAIAAAPLVIEGVEFSPEDFAYVGQVTFVPQFLVVGKNSEYETLDDLVSAMHEAPNEITAPEVVGWPSSAIAQTVFLSKAEAEAREVPGFEGGGERISSILGDHIDFAFLNLNEALPLYEAGEIRVLAVAAPERSDLMPDVPTFREQGYDVTTGVWRTVAAPDGTPEDVMNTLSEALRNALQQEDLAEDFEQVGLSIDYLTPEETREHILNEYQELQQVLADAGVELVNQ